MGAREASLFQSTARRPWRAECLSTASHTAKEKLKCVVIIDFYIIHGLILCLLSTLKKGQNLFGILVSSLQLIIFIIV